MPSYNNIPDYETETCKLSLKIRRCGIIEGVEGVYGEEEMWYN